MHTVAVTFYAGEYDYYHIFVANFVELPRQVFCQFFFRDSKLFYAVPTMHVRFP